MVLGHRGRLPCPYVRVQEEKTKVLGMDRGLIGLGETEDDVHHGCCVVERGDGSDLMDRVPFDASTPAPSSSLAWRTSLYPMTLHALQHPFIPSFVSSCPGPFSLPLSAEDRSHYWMGTTGQYIGSGPQHGNNMPTLVMDLPGGQGVASADDVYGGANRSITNYCYTSRRRRGEWPVIRSRMVSNANRRCIP
jgi:hypothetical protein